MADEKSFGRLVVDAACRETAAFFASIKRDLALAALSIAVGGGVFYFTRGFAAMREQIIDFAVFAIVPYLILVAIVCAWNSILAPFRVLYDRIGSVRSETPASSSAAAKSKPVNWAIWKQRNEISILEFGHILAKEDPNASKTTSEARAFHDLILEEVRGGRLKYIRRMSENYSGQRYERSIDSNTMIMRPDALAWAQSKGFDTSQIQ